MPTSRQEILAPRGCDEDNANYDGKSSPIKRGDLLENRTEAPKTKAKTKAKTTPKRQRSSNPLESNAKPDESAASSRKLAKTADFEPNRDDSIVGMPSPAPDKHGLERYRKRKENMCDSKYQQLAHAIEKCTLELQSTTGGPTSQSSQQNCRRRSSRVAFLPQEKRQSVLRKHAFDIAEACLCLETLIHSSAVSVGAETIPLGQNMDKNQMQGYKEAIQRARNLLHDWRTTLKKHDFVSCLAPMTGLGCGENLLQLQPSQVLDSAFGGDNEFMERVIQGAVEKVDPASSSQPAIRDEAGNTIVHLRDEISGDVVPYSLRSGEYAVLVHYTNCPVDFDRWVLLPYSSEEGSESDRFVVTGNGRFNRGIVVPLDAHLESTRLANEFVVSAQEEIKRETHPTSLQPQPPEKSDAKHNLSETKKETRLMRVEVSTYTGEVVESDHAGNYNVSSNPENPLGQDNTKSNPSTSKAKSMKREGFRESIFDSNLPASGEPSQTNQNEQAGRPAKEKKSKEKVKEEPQTEFTWICTECREAECFTDPSSPLLFCDGKCNRPFHYPCANLLSMPPDDEPWICSDCNQRRHQCAVCKLYGEDDVDLFCCDAKGCGLFFHERCLIMYNVDIQITEELAPVMKSKDSLGENTDKETDDISSIGFAGVENSIDAFPNAPKEEKITVTKEDDFIVKVVSRPKFRCPAHYCWTCCDDIPPPESIEAVEEAKKVKGEKKRKRANASFSSYGFKKERLFRCLDCPMAYHISCIPPAARFHELALLCHEHAYVSKLPYLDSETSFQAAVEAKADRKIFELKRKVESLSDCAEPDIKNRTSKENSFLPGVDGSFATFQENQLVDFLDENQSSTRKQNQFHYCLPCDFVDEVHSKPPSYTHINTNRYNPKNKPKRHPPANESCKCKPSTEDGIFSCGDGCLNRLSYVECVGDKSLKNGEKNPYWNCNCGPSCSNRGVSKRQFAKCRPMREHGKGWGLITVNGVKKGDLVQEYCGEIIDEKTKEERLLAWSRDHPNDPNFYVMHLEPGWYIDAREVANIARFINHSCDPNCKLVPVNVAGFTRVSIVCIKDVEPGGYLSYDYQFDTRHDEKFTCRCGSTNCRGTMKGGKTGSTAQKKTKKQLLAEAKARVQRDKKFLQSIADSEKHRLHLTGVLVPGEREGGSELVAGGPREKYRRAAQEGAVFLWRNARLGADFSSRYWRRMARMKNKSKRRERENLAALSRKLGNVDIFSLLRA